MNDRVHAIDCPSCGAPLELHEKRERFFQCKFCGETLEDQRTPEEQKTGEHPKIVIHAATVEKSMQVGKIILFVVIGFIVVSIFIGLTLSGILGVGGANLVNQFTGKRIYSFGLSRLVESYNETQPDVIGVPRYADETSPMVYVDFDADPHLRWESEPLGEEATYIYNHVTANKYAVYMAYETTLIALNREDGTTRWKQILSDQVSHNCLDCTLITGDWLVTLTDDGMLNGINTRIGELAWSVRLNETPRQLMNINGKVGVLDKDDEVMGINFFAAETGNLIQRIVPQCPNEVFPDSPFTLNIYDPMLVSKDGKHLYTPISGHGTGCLQKWDANTLSVVWETNMPRDMLKYTDDESYLLTDGTLYTSDGHNLSAVNLRDGSYQELFSDEDHNLIPLAEQKGVLITLAEVTRGTKRYSLWGINTSTKTKAWQYDPIAEDLYDGTTSAIHAEGLWSVGTDADQTIVLEAFTDPGRITFTVLNPMDGSIEGASKFDVYSDDASYWMQIPGWDGHHVYLEMDAQLWLFDALTGTKVGSWP